MVAEVDDESLYDGKVLSALGKELLEFSRAHALVGELVPVDSLAGLHLTTWNSKVFHSFVDEMVLAGKRDVHVGAVGWKPGQSRERSSGGLNREGGVVGQKQDVQETSVGRNLKAIFGHG